MAPERTRNDGPSREEVQQRINSLYDQAENATGTFNATRAMRIGSRKRATPAPDTARRRSDPALDEVTRPWFDAARAKLGPTLPAVLPSDRRPARAAEPRPARPASPPAEPTARPVPELTAGPVAALPAGSAPALPPAPRAELPPAPLAELSAAPTAVLPAVPAPRQEVQTGRNALPAAEPSWFPTPSAAMDAAPLPVPDARPADPWQLPLPTGQSTGAPLDAATPLYAGTLRDGNYALVTELPLVAGPFPTVPPVPVAPAVPVAEPFPVADPFPAAQTPYVAQPSYTAGTAYAAQTSYASPQTTYGTGAYLGATDPYLGAVAGGSIGNGIAFGLEPGAKAAKAAAFARAQIGRPCVWGAVGPGSYDNSGLIQAAWKAAGVALPRAVHEQASAGMAIGLADIRPGDLVFYHGDAGHVGHVGICVGDGTMMHAPSPGATVREDSIFAAGEAAIHSVLRPA
ncbi:C40 family peptidase [Streptomyces geranii]|uniref:C40 family peptidase n=1 Tax=Streptomyces geranii TaxID=2058923 RepID=UPI001E3D9DE1|nr:C40 family peptidase [Streptomyces geranii]